MKSKHLVLLALLGVYVNIIAFGFKHDLELLPFQFALINWFRDPSLYAGDPITAAFARYPTFFWLAVAHASAWIDTPRLLFLVFILTKVLFFFALVRLVAKFLKDSRLVACIVFSVALSPFLNGPTPFAHSEVLEAYQTQTPLVIALLLWVGTLLVEERWVSAAVLLGLTIYMQVLFAAYTLFAFAGFALLDWQRHKCEIVVASLLIGAIALPWLMLSRGMVPSAFPENYVETILMYYPYHYTLRSHAASELLQGSGILVAAAGMITVAAKRGITGVPRLELLAGSFLVPVLFGALVGEIFPFPSLVRLHFLRADSFLFLYSMVLVQVYGGRMLLSTHIQSPAAALLLGASAILFPLFFPLVDGLRPIILLLGSTLLVVHPLAAFVLATGLTLARVLGLTWIPGKLTALIAVVSGFFVYPAGRRSMRTDQGTLVPVVCGLVLILAMLGTIPHGSRLWNPIIAPRPLAVAWRDVQQWAKSTTPRDATFLVPPFPGGFRVLSERTSWVDWADADIAIFFPAYTEEWRRRMDAIGVRLVAGQHSSKMMIQQYKEQSWEHLLTVARAHKIDYVVQYTEVPYSGPLVFRNESFAVYKVTN